MASILWITLGAALLALIAFGVGAFLGRFLVYGPLVATISTEEIDPKMIPFLQRLTRMIQQLSSDVGRHQERIEASNSQLHATQDQSEQQLTEFVVSVVGKILESNEMLQKRLHSAESKLLEQGAQLDTYLTKSQTDSLTKLPNRRVFDERLRRCLEAYENGRAPFALLMLDLDHFKAVNDGFGHLGGDYVLRELGGILAGFASERLFVARLGGEEFAVLLAHENLEDAFEKAENIRQAVAEHYFSYEHVSLSITLSIGLAAIRDGENGADLLGRTDRALYAAKAAGRNRSFYHNGKTCQSIDVPHEPREDSQLILELCGELRQRMAQIARG